MGSMRYVNDLGKKVKCTCVPIYVVEGRYRAYRGESMLQSMYNLKGTKMQHSGQMGHIFKTEIKIRNSISQANSGMHSS